MSNKHTRASANKNGVTLSHTTTDSPLLPVEQIEKLHAIDPSRVAWVFEQTEIEAAYRRQEKSRLNTLIFTERLLSLFSALIIVLVAFGLATYLAINDHEVTASIIAGGGLVYIVSAFLNKKNS